MDDEIHVICHELRGALAPLATWSRLLSAGLVGAGDMRHVGEILERNTRLLARLTSDLSALSSAGSHRPRLTCAPVDVRAVVVEAVRAASQSARAREVMLLAQLPGEPVITFIDELRFAQVLGNLLDNALKFSDSGGKVVLEVVSSPGAARVIVTDSGMGIRSDFLPFVFEKFARGTPDDGGREGRGLGLHVVKTLVEAHGGTIAVESKGPGRGSRFIITLPARLAAAV